MNIAKLFKRLLFSFMLHIDDEGGGGGGDLASLFEARDGGGEVEDGTDPDAGAPQGDELTDEDLDAGGDDPNDPSAGDDADPVFQIPVGDGKTISKKQSELIAEASKYHGAEKKFEEAAAIRKDAEAKLAQVPERERQLGNVLEHYIRESQALMAARQPNWEALLAQDPQQYVRVRHAWEQEQSRLAQAQQIQQQLAQRKAQEDAVSLQGRINDEAQKIVAAIPEWKEPAKAAEGAKAVREFLLSSGISEQMQAQMDTAAVFLIARDAMLYRQAIARRKSTQQGVQQAPRVERPGASQVVPKTQVARAKADKAFKANPSVNTLASFFE